MKNTRQISLLVIMWFLVGLSILICSMFGVTRQKTSQFVSIALWILVIGLILYFPILQVFKSISSSYLVMFIVVFLPYLLLIYISQTTIYLSGNPHRVIVILVIFILLSLDTILRFHFQRNKLSRDFDKSPQAFGIDRKSYVGSFDIRLPSDTGEWFYSQGRLFQTTFALTPIIIRVILRSNEMIRDPLTHGLILSTVVIVSNEELLKLLFLGILLKKLETDTGKVIMKK